MSRTNSKPCTYRLFFDVPASMSDDTPIRKAIATVDGASAIEVSMPYRTARFRATENDCRHVRDRIESAGVLVIGLYQSP